MAKYKDTISEVTEELSESVREVNRTIAGSMVDVGERNVKFAQSTFEHEVELLRSHAKSTRALMEKLIGESEKGEPLFEFMADSAVAAQERTVKFVQRFLESGSEVLESNVEDTRTLIQKLTEQSRKQREALGVLVRGTWDAYRGFFPSPLSYYERVMETAESIARQGVETAEKITSQSVGAAEKATEKATHHEKQTAHSPTK